MKTYIAEIAVAEHPEDGGCPPITDAVLVEALARRYPYASMGQFDVRVRETTAPLVTVLDALATARSALTDPALVPDDVDPVALIDAAIAALDGAP
jgi:hypothetical protein